MPAKSALLVISCIGFAAGIWLGSAFIIPSFWIWLAIGAVAVILLANFLRRKLGYFRAATLGLLFCAIGVARIQTSFVPNQFTDRIGQKQDWEGLVTSEITTKEFNQQFTFRPDGFDQEILIIVAKSDEYFYGDRIWIKGKLTLPKNSADFDYQGYLARFNTYALMSYPQAVVIRPRQGNAGLWILLKIKQWFVARVRQNLPQPQADLLLGILIGARQSLPQTVVNNFNSTGVSHIIAISGYNISILIAMLAPLAKFLGRRASTIISLLVIIAFTLISGASASVLRAALMGGLLLAALNLGRQYAVTPALCLAGAIMLAVNPKILYWDVGFQLSFAATLGIVYLLPLLEQATASWPKFWQIKSEILTTFSAIIPTTPLLINQFGRLSLVAPLVNLLILPLVPLTMALGMGLALPGLAPGFALPARWLLSYMLEVTSRFAAWRWASLTVHPSPEFLVFAAACLAVLYGLTRYMVKSSHS